PRSLPSPKRGALSATFQTGVNERPTPPATMAVKVFRFVASATEWETIPSTLDWISEKGWLLKGLSPSLSRRLEESAEIRRFTAPAGDVFPDTSVSWFRGRLY